MNRYDKNIGPLDIFHCARCGQDHEMLTFKPFTDTVEDESGNVLFSHWCLCPINAEPILMKVENDPPAPELDQTVLRHVD